MSDTLTFVDPDGVETVFREANGFDVLWGVSGRFLPPVRINERDIPGQPGARVESVQLLPRDVGIPVHVQGEDNSVLRSLIRTFASRLNPTRGDGVLRNEGPDGEVRELTCRYAGGMEGTETKDESGTVWQRGMLIFRGSDPLWYGTEQVPMVFTSGVVIDGEPVVDDGTVDFLPVEVSGYNNDLGAMETVDAPIAPSAGNFLNDPFFPLRIGVSDVFGSRSINNPGDVEAWPVWTIVGPGSDLIIRNLQTGQVLELGVDLDPGESIEIDTRPGRKFIRFANGDNAYGLKSDGSRLWPLAKGPQVIEVSFSATEPESYVAGTFQPGYLTV